MPFARLLRAHTNSNGSRDELLKYWFQFCVLCPDKLASEFRWLFRNQQIQYQCHWSSIWLLGIWNLIEICIIDGRHYRRCEIMAFNLFSSVVRYVQCGWTWLYCEAQLLWLLATFKLDSITTKLFASILGFSTFFSSISPLCKCHKSHQAFERTYVAWKIDVIGMSSIGCDTHFMSKHFVSNALTSSNITQQHEQRHLLESYWRIYGNIHANPVCVTQSMHVFELHSLLYHFLCECECIDTSYTEASSKYHKNSFRLIFLLAWKAYVSPIQWPKVIHISSCNCARKVLSIYPMFLGQKPWMWVKSTSFFKISSQNHSSQWALHEFSIIISSKSTWAP